MNLRDTIAACLLVALTGCQNTRQATPKTEQMEVAAKILPAGRSHLANKNKTEDTFSILPFDADQLVDMPVQGRVVSGLRWKDIEGENVLVFSERLSEMPPSEDLDIPGEPARNHALFAAHYLKPRDGSETVLKRLVRDASGPCQFDVVASFVSASFAVSDLDADGVGEATFAYEVACRSDVSPSTMKLLLLEAGEKYILRGTRAISLGGGKFQGGDFTPGARLRQGHSLFLGHTSAMWKKISKAP